MTLPDTQPPFYFRRVWSGATPMDEVMVMERQPDGTLLINVGVPEADLPEEVRATAARTPSLAEEGLVIYGRAVNPEADRDYVRFMASRGQVFAQCFSVKCPQGEMGTHPRAALTPISAEEFAAAQERGWRP